MRLSIAFGFGLLLTTLTVGSLVYGSEIADGGVSQEQTEIQIAQLYTDEVVGICEVPGAGTCDKKIIYRYNLDSICHCALAVQTSRGVMAGPKYEGRWKLAPNH